MSGRRGGVLVAFVHDGCREGAHCAVGGGAKEVRDDAEVGWQCVGTDDVIQDDRCGRDKTWKEHQPGMLV